MFSTLTERGATRDPGRAVAGRRPTTSPSRQRQRRHGRRRWPACARTWCPGSRRSPAPAGWRAAAAAPRVRRPGRRAARRRPRGAGDRAARPADPTRSHRCWPRCRRRFPVPVLVAQHMPPRLHHPVRRPARPGLRRCRCARRPTASGWWPAPCWSPPATTTCGSPRPAGAARAALDQGPQENFCRPAADPLLRSAARIFGDGDARRRADRDGPGRPARLPRRRRGRWPVVVQDEATSVVWGMPGAVADAGLAHEVLPLDQSPPASSPSPAAPPSAPDPAPVEEVAPRPSRDHDPTLVEVRGALATSLETTAASAHLHPRPPHVGGRAPIGPGLGVKDVASLRRCAAPAPVLDPEPLRPDSAALDGRRSLVPRRAAVLCAATSYDPAPDPPIGQNDTKTGVRSAVPAQSRGWPRIQRRRARRRRAAPAAERRASGRERLGVKAERSEPRSGRAQRAP